MASSSPMKSGGGHVARSQPSCSSLSAPRTPTWSWPAAMGTAAWASGSSAGSRTSFWHRARCAACCRIEALRTPPYPEQIGPVSTEESTPMPIRDILLPMFSYPVMTAAASIERAVTLASGLGAHVSGLALELDIHLPVGLYAHPPEIGGILAAERRK